MEHPTRWQELTDHNVQKLGTEDGDITQIGTLRLTWKARGEKTGFQFGVYESELPPSAGIPLHKHPFAEFFYILEGSINFGRLNAEGTLEMADLQRRRECPRPRQCPTYNAKPERPSSQILIRGKFSSRVHFDKWRSFRSKG